MARIGGLSSRSVRERVRSRRLRDIVPRVGDDRILRFWINETD